MLARQKITEAARWAKTALDLLLPPRCLVTGEIVDRPGMLAARAWPEISFIAPPFCDCCGLPFSFEAAAGSLCGACLESPPAFDAARSAVVYDDRTRALLLRFKYADQLHAAATFAPWMIRAGGDVIARAHAIVPVPLHPLRLWRRRFNQSAVLAKTVARETGLGFLPDTLCRTRATPPQKGLNRKERRDNVKGAFAIQPRHTDAIKGRNILLVDDVLTSGATLHECARTLKKAGAQGVFVLTVARVTREDA